MGFIDFLKKLFGFGRKEKKVVVVEVENLDSFIGGKTKSEAVGLERQVLSRLAEVKHLRNELKSEIELLKRKQISTEEGNLRLRKIASSAHSNLVQQLSALAEKLEVPSSTNLSVLRAYSVDSFALINREIFSSRKSIVYAGTVLKEEIQRIGIIIKELNRVFSELKDLFLKSSMHRGSAVLSGTEKIRLLINEKSELETNLKEEKALLSGISSKFSSLRKELLFLQESEESEKISRLFKEKARLVAEKKNLKDSFISLLGRVEKPLSRFLKLAGSGSFPVEERDKNLLRLYVQNPFIALKSDPKGAVLKKLLGDVKGLVKDDSIALKEKEKVKRLRDLDELIEFNFFDEIFWKLNSIDAKINEVEKELSGLAISQQIDTVNKEIDAAVRELEEKQSLVNSLESKSERKYSEILEFKASLEKSLEELLNEKVIIRV